MTKQQQKGSLCLKMGWAVHFADLLRTLNKHQRKSSGNAEANCQRQDFTVSIQNQPPPWISPLLN